MTSDSSGAADIHVLIATDKYKGSLTAHQVCQALARGLHDSDSPRTVHTELLPVADGGDGTVQAVLDAGFTPTTARAADAVGIEHDITVATRGETSVIETAQICGMAALPELEPLRSSTYGIGSAILAALDAGSRRVIIGLGGSAATDGGTGMLTALGARVLDAHGRAVAPGGEGLLELSSVDWSGLDPRLEHTEIVALCDVDNPLLGASGAARVFSPQKGADAHEVDLLERALRRLVDVLGAHPPAAGAPADLATRDGAGAAGGLGFGVLCLGGILESGADHLLDLLDFDVALSRSDAVITGEGRLDEQTLSGKAPQRVAARAHAAGRTAVAVVGTCTLSAELVRQHFDAYYELTSIDARCVGDSALTEHLLADVGRTIAARYGS